MRRLLMLVSSIVLVDTMLYAALVPLLPGYAEEFGLSKGGAGFLVASYAAGALAGALPGGFLAARVGARAAAVTGLVVMAVASVGFAFAVDAWTLGLARFLQGFGSALSWAGALAWLVASSPRERRGELLGAAVGAAIFGALLGPLVGALAAAAGERETFLGVAGLFAGLAAWALRTAAVPAEPQPLREVLSALATRRFAGPLWLMVLPALLFGTLAVLVPLRLDEAGWGPAAIGAVFLGAAACEMMVSPLIGRVSDRRGRLAPLRGALAGSVVVTAALAWARAPGLVVVLVVAAALAYGAFWAPALALIADGAERQGLAHGIAFGFMNAAWAIGNVVGPALGGGLAQAVTDAVPYALGAGICLVTLAALELVRPFGTLRVRVPERP